MLTAIPHIEVILKQAAVKKIICGSIRNYDVSGGLLCRMPRDYCNPFGFIGGLDAGNGLWKLGARFYDSSKSAFIQQDRYLGDPSDPLSLNRYVYCGMDPVNFVDPTGFDAIHAISSTNSIIPTSGPGFRQTASKYNCSYLSPDGSIVTNITRITNTITFSNDIMGQKAADEFRSNQNFSFNQIISNASTGMGFIPTGILIQGLFFGYGLFSSNVQYDVSQPVGAGDTLTITSQTTTTTDTTGYPIGSSTTNNSVTITNGQNSEISTSIY